MVVALCALLTMSVVVATASAGNGGNKTGQACYKGAYANYYDPATRQAFASEEACVSYVAKGGTLKTKAQGDCESFGGTFGSGPDLVDSGFATVFWVCNGWTNLSLQDFATKLSTLGGDCSADGGGTAAAGSVPGSYNLTCGKF
jgi:hypothetical protein